MYIGCTYIPGTYYNIIKQIFLSPLPSQMYTDVDALDVGTVDGSMTLILILNYVFN